MLPPHTGEPRIPSTAGSRVFDFARIWQLTDPVFRDAAEMLAAAEQKPDLVVGIARGGVQLARLLGSRLGVPVAQLRARHNCSDTAYAPQLGTVTITGSLARPSRPNPAVLVADDICGTGDTFRAVLRHLAAELQPSRTRTVALCRNAGASFTPDAWLWDTRDWVVFPWDRPIPGPAEPLVLPPRPRGKSLP